MLAIEKSQNHKDATKRYWNPVETPGGKHTSYFRGRKLCGRKLSVPAGYRGLVVSKTNMILPKKSPAASNGEQKQGSDEEPDVRVVEELSDFENVLVWGHEAVPDESVDPYMKGVKEWIAFSERIHLFHTGDKNYPK